MIFTKRHTQIFTTIYILCLAASLAFSFFTSYFPNLTHENALILEGASFTNGSSDLELHRLRDEDKHISTFSRTFKASEIPNQGDNDYGIVLYRFASNGYKISLNGNLIGTYGDFKNGQSNLWNGGTYFAIDRSLLKAENILEIETFSHYASGFPQLPIVISDLDTIKKTYHKMHILNETIIAMSIGFVFFGGLAVFLLSFTTKENNKAYIYFSISAMAIGINALDYLPFEILGMDHLVFKKIVMGAFYLCAIAMTLALSEYFHMKRPKYVAYATVICYLFIVVFIRDDLLFNRIYSIFNASNILQAVMWLGIVYYRRKERFEANFLFIGFVGLVGFAIFNFMVDINDGFFILNTPLLYIILISVIIQFLIMMDFNYKEVVIALERHERKAEYEKAITDALTNVKNQRFIFHTLSNKIPSYTLSMMDIDDFKAINDTFGHSAGDFLLVEIAKLLKGHVKENDTICRYGGDEFIVFHNDEIGDVKTSLNVFLNAVRGVDFIYEGQRINITMSIGLYEVREFKRDNHLLKFVDKALYTAKESGKDRIVQYSDDLLIEKGI